MRLSLSLPHQFAFQALGVDYRIGTLDFDTEADFIMIDEERMEIVSTWIAGRRVYEQEK